VHAFPKSDVAGMMTAKVRSEIIETMRLPAITFVMNGSVLLSNAISRSYSSSLSAIPNFLRRSDVILLEKGAVGSFFLAAKNAVVNETCWTVLQPDVDDDDEVEKASDSDKTAINTTSKQDLRHDESILL
jgi:hypothetical protein